MTRQGSRTRRVVRIGLGGLLIAYAAGSVWSVTVQRQFRTAQLREVEERMTNHAGSLTRVGGRAPRFRITTLDGATLDLASCQGAPALLVFYDSSCGPCRELLQAIQRDVWDRVDHHALRLLVIARGETPDAARDFRRGHGYTFPVAADPSGRVYALYASDYVPRTYLVDTAGVIVYQCTGFYRGRAPVPRVIALLERSLDRVKGG
jgi:peroxiredoxin